MCETQKIIQLNNDLGGPAVDMNVDAGLEDVETTTPLPVPVHVTNAPVRPCE